MTKFECLNPECKKTFLYLAKVTDYICGGSAYPSKTIEKHVCPYCQSLNFQEYVEPVIVEKISSVKSVELDKVDEMITQGYEVKELYAKTAIMIKKEKQDSVTISHKLIEEWVKYDTSDGCSLRLEKLKALLEGSK